MRSTFASDGVDYAHWECRLFPPFTCCLPSGFYGPRWVCGAHKKPNLHNLDQKQLGCRKLYLLYFSAYGDNIISVYSFNGFGENSEQSRCIVFSVMESRCSSLAVLESPWGDFSSKKMSWNSSEFLTAIILIFGKKLVLVIDICRKLTPSGRLAQIQPLGAIH